LVDSKLDLVGFGALNVDIFYQLRPGGKVDQIVPGLNPGGERMGGESEREIILRSAGKYADVTGRSGGGQAANTAVALARMGFQCGSLGKVGDDEMGDFLLESLENVDKSHVRRGGNSGMCLCMLDQDGERANTVFPGCNDTVSLEDSDVEYVKSVKALHLTSFCHESVLEMQGWILRQTGRDLVVTFDPGEIYSRLGLDRVRDILQYTRVLFATSEELMLMTGKEPQRAAREIIRCGTDIVVWKQSGSGSEIISEDESLRIPAAKAEKVVDKTGAGDVYAAGFIAGLLLELPLKQCGRLASEVAALSISGYGREKYPDRRFLRKFLNGTGDMSYV